MSPPSPFQGEGPGVRVDAGPGVRVGEGYKKAPGK
jgi:hypothetical protein